MTIGSVLLVQLVLDLDHAARARAAPARRGGSSARSMRSTRALAQRLDRGADALGHAQPREAQRQRQAGDQRGDPQHARAGEAEQLHGSACRGSSRARRRHGRRQTALPTGTAGSTRATRWRASSSARPSQNMPARALGARPARRRRRAARRASAPSQARSADEHQPPDRIAEQEEREVGEPGAERAGLVVHRRRGCPRSRTPGRRRCAWPARAAPAARARRRPRAPACVRQRARLVRGAALCACARCGCRCRRRGAPRTGRRRAAIRAETSCGAIVAASRRGDCDAVSISRAAAP